MTSVATCLFAVCACPNRYRRKPVCSPLGAALRAALPRFPARGCRRARFSHAPSASHRLRRLRRLRGSFRPLPRRRPAVGNPTLAPAGGGCRSPSSNSDGVAARRRRGGLRPPRPGRRLGPARVDFVASVRSRDQMLLIDAAGSRRPPVPATVAGRGFAPRSAAPPLGEVPSPKPPSAIPATILGLQ